MNRRARMLILQRKFGQAIKIGDDITVTLLNPRSGYRNATRLGIEAPANIKILRQELLGNSINEKDSNNTN